MVAELKIEILIVPPEPGYLVGRNLGRFDDPRGKSGRVCVKGIETALDGHLRKTVNECEANECSRKSCQRDPGVLNTVKSSVRAGWLRVNMFTYHRSHLNRYLAHERRHDWGRIDTADCERVPEAHL